MATELNHGLAPAADAAGGRDQTPADRLAPKPLPTQSAADLWQWVKKAGVSFSDINGTVWASSFAYYAFFALVPMLLLLVTLGTDAVARFGGEKHAQDLAFKYITSNLDTYVPMSVGDQEMIHATIKGVVSARGRIGLLALAAALWTAMGFFQSLVGAINQAWGHQPLNWWKLPLKNLLMIGVLLSALLLGVVVPAILKTAQNYLAFAGTWTATIFTILGVLVPTVILYYGFLLFYKLAPRQRAGATFKEVWIPALVVTALLQASQQLFVFYATRITNFNAVYGAFGGVAALMLWTYISGLVIVFGGCLCAAQRQTPPAPVQSVA